MFWLLNTSQHRWSWFYATTTTCFCADTHWGRDKMVLITQSIFSSAFSWTKMYEYCLRFHWNFSPKVRIKDIPALVQIMAWRQPGDKPLSEPIMVILLTHICIPRPQWLNTIHAANKQQLYKLHATDIVNSLADWDPATNKQRTAFYLLDEAGHRNYN